MPRLTFSGSGSFGSGSWVRFLPRSSRGAVILAAGSGAVLLGAACCPAAAGGACCSFPSRYRTEGVMAEPNFPVVSVGLELPSLVPRCLGAVLRAEPPTCRCSAPGRGERPRLYHPVGLGGYFSSPLHLLNSRRLSACVFSRLLSPLGPGSERSAVPLRQRAPTVTGPCSAGLDVGVLVPNPSPATGQRGHRPLCWKPPVHRSWAGASSPVLPRAGGVCQGPVLSPPTPQRWGWGPRRSQGWAEPGVSPRRAAREGAWEAAEAVAVCEGQGSGAGRSKEADRASGLEFFIIFRL